MKKIPLSFNKQNDVAENILEITYEKIHNPKFFCGYKDVKQIAGRYGSSPEKINFKNILQDHAVVDALFFLEQECDDCHKEFKKIKRILDIGCGDGKYSLLFRRKNIFHRNIEYVGTEIDNEIVKACRSNYPDEKFLVRYADNLDFSSKYFDFIYCSSILQYTLNNWKKSLREINRVASKYVTIVRFPLSKFNRTFYVHQTVKKVKGIENHYFIVLNRIEFEDYIKRIGFKILKRDYSGEIYRIEKVNEPIMLCQYLLQVEKQA